jgi:hypothetical protein
LACNEAGFSSEGLAAGVPVLVAALFEAVLFEAALLEAGACASKVEPSKVKQRTMLVDIDFM